MFFRQRLKHHPLFADLLEGGECIAYGARALNEGGLQSIPKLTFPGGAIIGDSAGFLNVPKIKGACWILTLLGGRPVLCIQVERTHSPSSVYLRRTGTHTSMKSGMLAAEAAFTAIESSRAAESESEAERDPLTAPGLDVSSYQSAFESSWIHKELKEVRNLRPSFHSKLGNWGGLIYSGIDSLLLKGRVPWTFHHPEEDYQATKPAK